MLAEHDREPAASAGVDWTGIIAMRLPAEQAERLIAATHHGLRTYIALLGMPADAVDDIAQEAYLALFNQERPLPDGVDAMGWLKGTARNLVANHHRTQQRRSRHLVRIGEYLAQTTVADAQAGEEAHRRRLSALGQCLDRLPEAQRQLLRRCYQGGVPLGDIAKEIGRSIVGLRVTLHRLRTALRGCIAASLGGADGA